MTVEQYLKRLGWSISDFARYANVERHTARKAARGGVVSARTAQKIAAAFSSALGEKIYPGDIPGLTGREDSHE